MAARTDRVAGEKITAQDINQLAVTANAAEVAAAAAEANAAAAVDAAAAAYKAPADGSGIPPADLSDDLQALAAAGVRYDATSGNFLAADGSIIDTAGTVIGSVPFSNPGGVTGRSGSYRLVAPGTLQAVSLTASTAPAGSALSVDVLLDGVVIETVALADGSTVLLAEAALGQTFGQDALLAVDATSSGSTTAATGIVVQIDYVLDAA